MSSWSEEVKLKINANTADLKSEYTGSQLADWGKNKKNIEKFIATFTEWVSIEAMALDIYRMPEDHQKINCSTRLKTGEFIIGMKHHASQRT